MWNDPTDTDDEIVVYADPDPGESGGGDVVGMKMAAAEARDILEGGGQLLVIIGGVAMVVGGYTAWTGGGAGMFVAGTATAGVGAGAWWLSSMLDSIVRDPPQADYKRPAYVVPARMNCAALGLNSYEPAPRAFRHLNHLAALTPAVLNAIERQQGAALAGDKAWQSRWQGAHESLWSETLARIVGLGDALGGIASNPASAGSFKHRDLAKGLDYLHSKAGWASLEKHLLDSGFYPEIFAGLKPTLGKLTQADLPPSADLGVILRSMSSDLIAFGQSELRSA